MKSTMMTIDPALAEKMLGTMKHNRRLSTRNVAFLVDQMKTGLWMQDGSPIRFNTENELIDGQHRLWAIIEAEFTAEFFVLYGVEHAAMATMDTGKTRSFSDILTLEEGEIPQVTGVASTTQVLYRWEDGRRGSGLVTGGGEYRVPNAVLLQFFREHRERIIEVNRSGNTTAKKIRGLSGTTMALAYWVLDAIDAADAEYFFEHLVSGVALEDGSPILALRNYLVRATQGADARQKLPLDLGVALILKAWNAYREGDPIKVMTYRRGGASPEAFPTPK